MNLAIAIKKGQSPLNSSAIPSLVCWPLTYWKTHLDERERQEECLSDPYCTDRLPKKQTGNILLRTQPILYIKFQL